MVLKMLKTQEMWFNFLTASAHKNNLIFKFDLLVHKLQ